MHPSVLCTVAAALNCPALLQIGGKDIRSMCGAARWLLQQVWLGLCLAKLCKQQCCSGKVLRAAEPGQD